MMSKRICVDEVFRNRIIRLADYVIYNGMSSKRLMKYVKQIDSSITEEMVLDDLTRKLKYIDYLKYQQVRIALGEVTIQSIQEMRKKKRIYQMVSFLLRGYSLEEIAYLFGICVFDVYEVLTEEFVELEDDKLIWEQVYIMLQKQDYKKASKYQKLIKVKEKEGKTGYGKEDKD